MSKYSPLRQFLESKDSWVELTFDEVADLVGGLPDSAYQHEAWWGNEDTHVQSAAWQAAGKRVESVSLTARRVRFAPV